MELRSVFHEKQAEGFVIPRSAEIEKLTDVLNQGVARMRDQFVARDQLGTYRDNILLAARMSHKFVCIHPYRDGNGRVSRLLMNLALFGERPPVYLKADKKGRHRYGIALQRADRGNLDPLACLICINLIEIYEKILKTMGTKNSRFLDA
jgi:Fic family protein